MLNWFGNNYDNFFFQNSMHNRIHYNLMKIKLYLLTLLYFFLLWQSITTLFAYVCQKFHVALKLKASLYAF